MACASRPVKYEVTLDTNGQTREKVLQVVEALFKGSGGNIQCGIMGHFSMSFGTDSNKELGGAPGPELAKHGVISLKTTVSD